MMCPRALRCLRRGFNLFVAFWPGPDFWCCTYGPKRVRYRNACVTAGASPRSERSRMSEKTIGPAQVFDEVGAARAQSSPSEARGHMKALFTAYLSDTGSVADAGEKLLSEGFPPADVSALMLTAVPQLSKGDVEYLKSKGRGQTHQDEARDIVPLLFVASLIVEGQSLKKIASREAKITHELSWAPSPSPDLIANLAQLKSIARTVYEQQAIRSAKSDQPLVTRSTVRRMAESGRKALASFDASISQGKTIAQIAGVSVEQKPVARPRLVR